MTRYLICSIRRNDKGGKNTAQFQVKLKVIIDNDGKDKLAIAVVRTEYPYIMYHIFSDDEMKELYDAVKNHKAIQKVYNTNIKLHAVQFNVREDGDTFIQQGFYELDCMESVGTMPKQFLLDCAEKQLAIV